MRTWDELVIEFICNADVRTAAIEQNMHQDAYNQSIQQLMDRYEAIETVNA